MNFGACNLSHFSYDGVPLASQLISLPFSNYIKYARRKIPTEEKMKMKILNKTGVALFQTIKTQSH